MNREQYCDAPIELGRVRADTRGEFWAGVDTELAKKPPPGLTED